MWDTIRSSYRSMSAEGSTLLGHGEGRNLKEKGSNFAVFYQTWLLPLIAECIGQIFFAFLHSMTANAITLLGTTYPLLPALTDGLFLVAAILIISPISGAHLNGAVSTAFVLTGNMNILLFPFYVIVQLTGSIIGAEISMFVTGTASGQFVLGEGVTEGRGVMCEIMLTFLLIFVILISAVDQNSPMAAFAIGLTALINIIAGRGITGGCMNPTLSFGPALVSGSWTSYWVYWVGPLIGAILASLVYRILFATQGRRLCCNNDPDDAYYSEEEKRMDPE